MPQAPSTRWCPTPEQLMILEEMYRSGIRTPNASQIQQITAHLSYYGKIEGKNVFYWFQNHKARDRQKMRRRLSRHQQLLQGASQMMPQQPPSPQQVFQMELPHPPLHHFPYYQSSPHFLHQGNCSESTPVMNLVCKFDSCGREGEMERSPVAKAGTGKEWMTMVDMATTSTSAPPCCGTLKTLDLFPTTSTGLRDDYGTTSKSSSCSTSTTN